uniref:Uncharacterized protein n=1 Tax=Setaria italica TaxID=4555 RepID=K3ZKN7_SETIT
MMMIIMTTRCKQVIGQLQLLLPMTTKAAAKLWYPAKMELWHIRSPLFLKLIHAVRQTNLKETKTTVTFGSCIRIMWLLLWE